MGVERPISTTMFPLVKGANPEAFTVTVYVPGFRLTTLKPPLSSVVAVASLFVPLFLAVTAAPATTSLFGFVTEPFIAPVVVDWAIALSAQTASTKREAKQKRRNLHISGKLLKEISTLRTILPASHRAQSELRLPRTLRTACSKGMTGNKCRRRFLS